MSSGRLRRRLDRVARTVLPESIAPFHDPDHLEAVARRAGLTPDEVVAEARRIDALCRGAGAFTQDARLSIVAADGMVPVEALRAGMADLEGALAKDAA